MTVGDSLKVHGAIGRAPAVGKGAGAVGARAGRAVGQAASARRGATRCANGAEPHTRRDERARRAVGGAARKGQRNARGVVAYAVVDGCAAGNVGVVRGALARARRRAAVPKRVDGCDLAKRVVTHRRAKVGVRGHARNVCKSHVIVWTARVDVDRLPIVRGWRNAWPKGRWAPRRRGRRQGRRRLRGRARITAGLANLSTISVNVAVRPIEWLPQVIIHLRGDAIDHA